ncbi:DUF3105 domain-containing protein [Streptomyces sp. PmtG]
MGSAGAKQKRADRREKVAELRRAEEARQRRNRLITWTCSGAVVIGVTVGSWYLVDQANERDERQRRAAAAPIKGEKSFADLGRDHVTTPVDYKMSPAAGGNHHPVWMNCDGDVYDKEIEQTNAVHSLEHGAVWVTYGDKAPAADVRALKARVAKTPYSLMSPYAGQSAAFTLSAWGKQLSVASASDPRVEKFFTSYVQGAQTPEPGAACTGGKAA